MRIKWTVLLAFGAVLTMWLGIFFDWDRNVILGLAVSGLFLAVLEISRD